MAFSEIELKRIDATVGDLCRRMTMPEHVDQLRFVYDIDGHAVSLMEERPPWDGSPGAWTRHGVARFPYLRSRGHWLLYWMRADLKWHRYDPALATADLKQLVRVVEDDEYGAFFG